MKLKERGVLNESDVYFYTDNGKSRSFFYYILCAGHYWCNGQYAVKHKTLDSYLLIYVKKGSGYIVTNNVKRPLIEGQLAILNIYEHPSYGSTTGWEILWTHFDGPNITNLYKSINSDVITATPPERVEKYLMKIIDPFTKGSQPHDAIVSKYISDLLTEFFIPDSDEFVESNQRKFHSVYDYINNNLETSIQLDTLASIANLSRYYFIRAFKEETGMTPHEYVLKTRINRAIYCLSATQLTLSEITYKCGFSNESAFSNTFKKITGKTPMSYRKGLKSERVNKK